MRPGAAALVGLLVGLAACGGQPAPAGSEASSGSSTVGDVIVADAWIRPTPPVSNVGAFYLTIRNAGDAADAVIGATAPRCDEIEIHQTATVDDVSSMAPAEPAVLELPAGADLVFEPSGLHMMCLGLDEPVEVGEQLLVTIELDRAGPVTVEAVAENR